MTIKLREVTADEAHEFMTGDSPSAVHACGDPDCIVPRPAPHKQRPDDNPAMPLAEEDDK